MSKLRDSIRALASEERSRRRAVLPDPALSPATGNIRGHGRRLSVADVAAIRRAFVDGTPPAVLLARYGCDSRMLARVLEPVRTWLEEEVQA